MIHIDFYNGTINRSNPKHVGQFKMPAVPRIGDVICTSFERLLNMSEAYGAEAVKNGKRYNGVNWEVVSVEWDANFGTEGRVRVILARVAV